MRISCDHCGKYFKIPEDKIPQDASRVRFKCPACGQVNVLKPVKSPSSQGDEDSGLKRGRKGVQFSFNKPGSADPEGLQAAPEQVEPDLFPPGAKTVFLALQHQTWLQAAKSWLQEQGFYISESGSTQEGCQKLRLNNYCLVLLEDRPENNLLLQEIHSWPGNMRRQVNVILVGKQGRSFDPGLGFVKGVNQYLCLGDQDRVEKLLSQCQQDFERWLEPWNLAQEMQG